MHVYVCVHACTYVRATERPPLSTYMRQHCVTCGTDSNLVNGLQVGAGGTDTWRGRGQRGEGEGRERRGEHLLTYLVARFVRLLLPHPPLVVQFDGHAVAAGGVLADPAEELLQLPPEGGVGGRLAALGLTRLGLKAPWWGRGGGRRGG